MFLGGCVLPLYAREHGADIRTTEDVDLLSTLQPWILQERIIGDLCSAGVLAPLPEMQHRYRLLGTNLVLDIMSPHGMNIGGGSSLLRRAAEHPATFDFGDGETVKAVTPPYFVALKLEAFLDRGEDLISAKDIEDIVFVAAEVPDLLEQVNAAGLRADIAALWARVFNQHHVSVSDLVDMVDAHITDHDRGRREEIAAVLARLATSE